MANKRKIPEIRFKGFENKWIVKELGEIAPVIMGQSPKGYNYTDNPDDHILVQGNADIKNGLVVPRVWTTEVTKTAKNGDLILSVRAPVGEVGKTDYQVVLGRGVAGISGNEFIYQYLLRMNAVGYWKKLSCGSTFDSINSNSLRQSEITIPNESEQSKIGTFFKNLDSFITLHQRKYDKLTTVKKAMLEKMFPKDGSDVPEIRFKGFTEKWEQRQLGEIIYEEKRPVDLKDNGTYRLVTVKRRNGGVVSRGKLRGKDILVKNYFEVRTGDYIISKRQVVHGANGVVPQSLDKAIVSNEYLVAVGNERITTDFFALFSKLPHMYKKFFLSSYGIDIEKLVFDVEDWKKRYVVVPCLTEQQRISSFFQNLDSLITLQQRELDKLKNIKKSCLEKMFV